MKIPCEDCITLVMCKSRYIYIDTHTKYKTVNIIKLLINCSIFEKWCNKNRELGLKWKDVRCIMEDLFIGESNEYD